MGRSDLRLNYPLFNNSCSASYSELSSVSHLVPCAPNNSPLHLHVLISSLTLRLTLEENEHLLMLHIYQTLHQPLTLVIYVKCSTALWRRGYFWPPTANSFFILQWRKQGSEKLRNLLPAPYRAGVGGGVGCESGWLQGPPWFHLLWERPSIPRRGGVIPWGVLQLELGRGS